MRTMLHCRRSKRYDRGAGSSCRSERERFIGILASVSLSLGSSWWMALTEQEETAKALCLKLPHPIRSDRGCPLWMCKFARTKIFSASQGICPSFFPSTALAKRTATLLQIFFEPHFASSCYIALSGRCGTLSCSCRPDTGPSLWPMDECDRAKP